MSHVKLAVASFGELGPREGTGDDAAEQNTWEAGVGNVAMAYVLCKTIRRCQSWLQDCLPL
jgi:hypothetical protein